MEEDDALKGWKKTQPKNTNTFKPADLRYFQIGADSIGHDASTAQREGPRWPRTGARNRDKPGQAKDP